MTKGRTQWLVAFVAGFLCFLMQVWLSFAATAIPAITCGYDAKTRHANKRIMALELTAAPKQRLCGCGTRLEVAGRLANCAWLRMHSLSTLYLE
jgi:hypothetical protein